ncbi:unnamed protein product, partial [Adineta steineri]
AILSSSSKNLCTGSQCDQTKSVGKEPTDMKATTSPSDDYMEKRLKAFALLEGREINLKSLPSNHPDLTTSSNNIGSDYYNMKDYS